MVRTQIRDSFKSWKFFSFKTTKPHSSDLFQTLNSARSGEVVPVWTHLCSPSWFPSTWPHDDSRCSFVSNFLRDFSNILLLSVLHLSLSSSLGVHRLLPVWCSSQQLDSSHRYPDLLTLLDLTSIWPVCFGDFWFCFQWLWLTLTQRFCSTFHFLVL